VCLRQYDFEQTLAPERSHGACEKGYREHLAADSVSAGNDCRADHTCSEATQSRRLP